MHGLAQGLEFPQVTGTISCFSQMKINVFAVDELVVLILVAEDFTTASFKCHPPSQCLSFPPYLLSKAQDEVTLLNVNSC